MFSNIPLAVQKRMKYLEEIDARDRENGTAHMQRLRQVPAETGKFIALLAANAPKGRYIEIGTSAGYSALWLSLACREASAKLTTYEISEEKARLARETFEAAGVNDVIELVADDALHHVGKVDNISFCFLDAEKEAYSACYEAVIPKMVSGGILIADNAINHKESLASMLKRALADERVDAMIVPIGKGELVCRKI